MIGFVELIDVSNLIFAITWIGSAVVVSLMLICFQTKTTLTVKPECKWPMSGSHFLEKRREVLSLTSLSSEHHRSDGLRDHRSHAVKQMS